MQSVSAYQHTYRADTGLALGIKTVAIATNDVTFELTLSTTTAFSTSEFTDATAIPSQSGVFGIAVTFTES
jgi:hypothetical protein